MCSNNNWNLSLIFRLHEKIVFGVFGQSENSHVEDDNYNSVCVFRLLDALLHNEPLVKKSLFIFIDFYSESYT